MAMLDISPHELEFLNVRLKQAYTTSLCLSNPMSAAVEFSLRTSSPRLSVSPTRVNLCAGQSIVVTVRLFLTAYPNSSRSGGGGQQQGVEDLIYIKSDYFDQKVKSVLYLMGTDVETVGRGRSESPAGLRRSGSATRMSSASPGGRRSGSSPSGAPRETMAELRALLHSKDEQIKLMEGTIGELEGKFPSLQAVIKNRVEQERCTFEEKSAKVLQILHRKDAIIQELEGDLKDRDQEVRQLKIAGVNASQGQGQSAPSSSSSSSALREGPASAVTMDDKGYMFNLLDKERAEHKDTVAAFERILKEERAGHEEQLDRLRDKLKREEATNDTHRSSSPSRELRGLREMRAEQSEQIEVLVSEVSRLQTALTDGTRGPNAPVLEEARREITRMQREAEVGHGRLNDMTAHNAELKGMLDIAKAAREETETKQLTQAASMTNVQGTVVGELTQTVREKNAAIGLIQERAQRAEDRVAALTAYVGELQEREDRVTEQCQQAEKRAAGGDREGLKLADRLDRVVAERDELLVRMEDAQGQLHRALDKADATDAKTEGQDANVWWSYVWHELKHRDEESARSKEGAPSSGSGSGDKAKYTAAQEGDLLADVQRLREQLRESGTDLATTRQELLGRRLAARREHESLREQLYESHREVKRLQAHARAHKGDREVKIAELNATIRMLSARTDMHAQVATARQDLEAEKLSNHHLRCDLDAYRDMVDVEQNKVGSLRKDVTVLQGTLDAMSVLKTVLDVPGVEANMLIEAFSGKMVSMQAEASRARADCAQAQSAASAAIAEANHRASLRLVTDRENHNPNRDGDREGSSSGGGGHKSISPSGGGDTTNNNMTMSCMPTNLNVDASTTPRKVLESLDAAALAQRVAGGEATITALKQRVSELEEDVVRGESSRLGDRDAFEESLRAELSTSIRKHEMSVAAADMAKQETRDLQSKCAILQKEIIMMKSEAGLDRLTGALAKGAGGVDVDALGRSALYAGENESSMDDSEEESEDMRALRSQLREKTAQLKVASDSLDALTSAGVNPGDVYSLDGGLADLAAAPMPTMGSGGSSGNSYGLQGLIKRVVEVTSELSAQTTGTALESRRAEHLEAELRKRNKLNNRIRTSLKKHEDAVTHAQMQVTTLAGQLRESERQRVDEVSSRNAQCDELAYALKESEAQVNSLAMTVEELTKQAAVAKQVDFQQWLESVVLCDTSAVGGRDGGSVAGGGDPNQTSDLNGTLNTVLTGGGGGTRAGGGGEPIRELVTVLLGQWQESVGYSRGLAAATSGAPDVQLSKAEQKFLQRIVDLVASAHERTSKAHSELRFSEIQRAKVEMTERVLGDRLKSCVQHLHVYRKRALAAEQVLGGDAKHALRRSGKLAALLRNSLADARKSLHDTSDRYVNERRERSLVELRSAATLSKLKRYEARIGELESKGDANLVAREEAAHNMESRVVRMELDLNRWFKNELPKLASGMPVGEDMHSFSGPSPPAPAGDGDGPDRNYALAQALCVSKAAQASQEMRMNVLLEKNYLLRDKVSVMEGVLMKWRSDVAGDESLSVEARERREADALQGRVEQMYGIAGREAAAEERVRTLSDKLLVLQEDNMELRGRADHASERSDELKNLVDSVMQEEQVLKTKATQQITRIRLDLESRHADELRGLREAYEDEKGLLTEELEQISAAFQGVSRAAAAMPPLPPRSPGPGGAGALRPVGEQHDQQTALADVAAIMNNAGATMNDKIASLQRSLEVERNRYNEAKYEAAELEGLLAIQRQTLGAASPNGNNNTPSKRDRDRSARDVSFSSAGDGGDSVSQVEVEVEREDSALWPSLSTLLDEMLRLLRAIPRKHKDLAKDATCRTALAMAVRIKSICGSPRGRSALNGNGHDSGGEESEGRASGSPTRDKGGRSGSRKYSPSPSRRGQLLSDESDDAEGDVAVNSAVKSLVRRVHLLEDDLADVNVPERHMFMLRELRVKVLELETTVHMEIERARSEHKDASSRLATKLVGAEGEIIELRRSQTEGIGTIRERYEEALRQAQDALDSSHEAASSQVQRLEQLLSKCQAENESLRSETSHLRSETKHLRPMSEVLQMQNIVDRASDELESSKERLRGMEEKHSLEVRALREHFNGFKQAQDRTVASLESQLEAMRTAEASSRPHSIAPSVHSGVPHAHAHAGGDGGSSDEALEEAHDKLRRLEYQFKSKCSELDAAVNALGRTSVSGSQSGTMGGGDPSHNVTGSSGGGGGGGGGDGDGGAGAPPLTPPAPGAMAGMTYYATASAENTFSVNDELINARLSTAEGEIDSLQNQLTLEKRLNADIRSELQKMRDEEARFDAMAMAGGSPGPDADPRLRGMSRRLSELRRNAKAEVSKLKSQLAAATGQIDTFKGMKEEYGKMKAIHDATSAQLGSIRDDNSRKAKLLSSMKAAKATDNNAVEQWRNEVSELEEKVKRQGRAIASKESIIRDLKGRIEEDVSEAATSGDVHTATLTANELRQRLRVADLERARARSRVGSMKDKISELEAELALLREEGERLRRTSDRAEATRAALARKDALFRSQKAALEKVKAELEDVREDANGRLAEGERRVRNLQRQLAETEQQRLEAERECELMRRRATGSAVRLGEYPAAGVVTRDVADYVNTGRAAHAAHSAATAGGSGSAREVLKQSLHHRSAPAPVAPYPPRQRQTRPTDVAAALSLGLDADDLGDVIAALGDNTGISAALNAPSESFDDLSSGSMLGPSAGASSSGTGSTSGGFHPYSARGGQGAAASPSASASASASDMSIERRLKSLARAALESPAPKKR